MTVSTIPPVTPLLKFFDNNGAPLAYGKLFTYQTATSTKQATYTDSTGNTPNTNPVILNARGEANVWLDGSLVYKFVLSNSTDTDPPSNPIWTEDPIGSFNVTSTTGNFTTVTASSFVQAANFIVTGSTLPPNGIYLPAANQLGFATNTTARGYIDTNGIWNLLSPAASGPTLIVPALGINNNNTIVLPTAGSMITFARSSDGSQILSVGPRPSTASISLYNGGGTTTEVEAAANNVNLATSGANRVVITSPGNVTVNAPASGVALTVNSVAGTHSTKIANSVGTVYNAGFLEVPQNTQNTNYAIVNGDSGKHIYHSDGTARTYTIPANASISFPIGTTLSFVNDASAAVNVTIAITTDTMYWAVDGTTGSRTLARYGIATALKVGATRWTISGTGLS